MNEDKVVTNSFVNGEVRLSLHHSPTRLQRMCKIL